MTNQQLPPGWTAARLEDLVQSPSGLTDGPFGSNLKTEHYTNAGPRVVRLQNIGDGRFVDERAHISADRFAALCKHEVRANDVLIASLGENLPRACLAPSSLGPAIVKADCIRMRVAPGCSAAYVMWALNSPSVRAHAGNLASGVGRTRLGLRVIRDLEVPVPPSAEQERIVAELERRFAHLDAVEQGLRISLSKLVTASDATIRDAALPVPYQGHDLPELPDGWEWTTLDEVADVVGGVTKDSKRQHDPEYVEVPYLRVANVQRGFLALDEIATIRVPPRKAESLRLQNGDLLFNEGGDRDKLGRGWVWHGEIDNCIHQNHVFRARLTDSRLAPELVSWWGNTFGRTWFESHGKQTTNLASINLKTLKSFPVPVPPSGEGPVRVTEAQRRLSIIESCTHDVKRSIERIAALRRSLLAAAFSGRLVPQDPDDEPASELLARIGKTRAEAEAAEKEAKAAARRAKKATKETLR